MRSLHKGGKVVDSRIANACQWGEPNLSGQRETASLGGFRMRSQVEGLNGRKKGCGHCSRSRPRIALPQGGCTASILTPALCEPCSATRGPKPPACRERKSPARYWSITRLPLIRPCWTELRPCSVPRGRRCGVCALPRLPVRRRWPCRLASAHVLRAPWTRRTLVSTSAELQ